MTRRVTIKKEDVISMSWILQKDLDSLIDKNNVECVKQVIDLVFYNLRHMLSELDFNQDMWLKEAVYPNSWNIWKRFERGEEP